MSGVDWETGETADPPPDADDLERGAGFTGDYPDPPPAHPDTACEEPS